MPTSTRLLLALLALLGCDPAPAPVNPAPPPTAPPVASAAAPASPAVSLYDLPTQLTDAQGRPTTLAAGKGHPTLVSMFYTSCRAACPMLIAGLKQIEERVPAERRADLRVVLVSFDPDRDTPAVLTATAAQYGLDDRWLLMTADADQVRDIAAALGFQYRRRPDGDFDHSSIITLVDETGVIEARMDSATAPNDAVVEAIGGA